MHLKFFQMMLLALAGGMLTRAKTAETEGANT